MAGYHLKTHNVSLESWCVTITLFWLLRTRTKGHPLKPETLKLRPKWIKMLKSVIAYGTINSWKCKCKYPSKWTDSC